MVIIRQWGGLGNQMFIDAFVEAVTQKNDSVKIDTSYYNYFDGEYELSRIFGIDRSVATSMECGKLAIYQLDNC